MMESQDIVRIKNKDKDKLIHFSSTFYKAIGEKGREILAMLNTNKAIQSIWSSSKNDYVFLELEKPLTSISFLDIVDGINPISYLPVNKIALNDDGTFYYNSKDNWSSSQRQYSSIGRVFNRIIRETGNPPLQNNIIEEITNSVKAYLNSSKITFEVVSGEEIRRCYLGENYIKEYEKGSSLHNSCMRYSECQGYLDIYTENPEVCSLLVAKNGDGFIIGRALVWKTTEDIMIVDRTYCYKEHLYQMFRDEAKKRGWKKKEIDNNNSSFRLIDDKTYQNLDIQLKNYMFDSYPYLDTFIYLDIDNGILSNTNDDMDNWRELQGTDGNYSNTSEEEDIDILRERMIDRIADWVKIDILSYMGIDYILNNYDFTKEINDFKNQEKNNYKDDFVYLFEKEQVIKYIDLEIYNQIKSYCIEDGKLEELRKFKEDGIIPLYIYDSLSILKVLYKFIINKNKLDSNEEKIEFFKEYSKSESDDLNEILENLDIKDLLNSFDISELKDILEKLDLLDKIANEEVEILYNNYTMKDYIQEFYGDIYKLSDRDLLKYMNYPSIDNYEFCKGYVDGLSENEVRSFMSDY